MSSFTLATSDDPGNSRLEGALRCAARGWHVFPIEPRAKVPLGALAARGFLDATTEVEMIRRWWTIAPDANVGIRTGAVSGLVVLDVDPRHGGDEALHELERQHGQLPETITALTGGGGSHLFFAHPRDGVMVRSATRGAGLARLGVRGGGGYIVAPPRGHVP